MWSVGWSAGGGWFSRCEVPSCPHGPLGELSVWEGGREGPFPYSPSDCGCDMVLFVGTMKVWSNLNWEEKFR